ncbi:DUF2567 domain-containing protein [Rhodococcus tibetensis]|uniref:DUF2567 domain-containing protein n=1 Tax=Rhodococcus tibetensis TaxID=2965064 RepID=A0ABT1QA39_9NOCA|nr:DUF2567 domain-containing protein [Rhodococcus sp. FXJ9.536]MCQ4119101.1 DUF2567 domain-containing protein [Rhodococcus sp. FXJ9.536]
MTTLPRIRLRSAAGIVCGTLVASALVGAMWGVLAPAEHLLVVAPDRGVSLTGESVHRFDAIGMFACAGLVVGIVAAVAAWAARRSRGPVALAAVVAGNAVGAGVMALGGLGVAALRFPDADVSTPGTIVAVGPGIGTLLVLLFQPLAACVVTLVLAALNPYDDLGVSDPPVELDEDPPVELDEPEERDATLTS